ncbi:iron-containing alcohol dehydrogenase [Porticoccus sp. GXU_MW_L64]
MLNFTFHNPTRVHFGEGQITNIANEIPRDAKILMTYGSGSIKQNGVYDQVREALKEHENVIEFPGIEPNPTYEKMMQAVALIKEHGITYILAVGGGSVIDGSKFAAAAACYQGDDPWDILAKGAAVEAALPLGCVLTLPATGTETNIGAVLTRDGSKLPFGSPHVTPRFAILDPSITLTLSDRQICNGVVDAFVHTLEQYLTYPVNGKVQDRFAEGLLQTLIEEGGSVFENREDIDIRSNIMWSATLALNGLIGSGVPQDWSSHGIGHELTAMFGIDHARTLSIIVPANLKLRKEAKREKLLQYAERVWGLTDGEDSIKIDQAIQFTEIFFQDLNMPTRLSHEGVAKDAIQDLINSLKKHGMLNQGEKGDVDLATCEEILIAAL